MRFIVKCLQDFAVELTKKGSLISIVAIRFKISKKKTLTTARKTITRELRLLSLFSYLYLLNQAIQL